MRRVEFEALLKIQGRYLLMCEVFKGKHRTDEHLFSADVEDGKGHIVLTGIPAKTPSAAVQKTIARYFKHANH